MTEQTMQMSEKESYKLPDGWKWARLGEIVEINREQRNPSIETRNEEFIYIDISGVESGTGRIKEIKRILGKNAPSRARRVVHTNDVIMSTVRPYLKSFAIIPEKYNNQICSTGFAVLTCRDRILPKYLLYALFSDMVIDQCNRMMIGAHYPALRESQVSQIKVPLPPLEEQRRIVNRIEQLLGKVEEARRLRQQARAEAEQIMRAALHKVFSRAEEEGWELVKLGDILKLANGKFITKKQLKSEREKPYTIPVYGSNGVVGYTVKASINFDSLIIGRVGACGAVNFAQAPCWISDNAMYVEEIDSSKVSLYFLYWLLKNCDLGKFVKKAAQPSISQRPILNLQIPLPPLEEQKRIVANLDKIKETAESLKKLQQKTDEELEKLVPSILDKAFRGGL